MIDITEEMNIIKIFNNKDNENINKENLLYKFGIVDASNKASTSKILAWYKFTFFLFFFLLSEMFLLTRLQRPQNDVNAAVIELGFKSINCKIKSC